MAAADLLLGHRRRTDEDVLAEVVRRQLGDLAGQQRGHLLGGVTAAHVLVPLPHHVGRPVGGRLGHHVLESREALEDPGEEQVPHGPGRPPDHLGQVDADVVVVLVLRRLARVGVHGETGGLARRPHRVVVGVVVGLEVVPHRRHHDALGSPAARPATRSRPPRARCRG